jgi:hypothetical protein
MLRIPLPEDDRFALRLSSLCVSVPSASSGGRLRSRISLALRGATEQEIAILRNLVAPSWQSCPKGPCGAPFCVFCVFCGFKIPVALPRGVLWKRSKMRDFLSLIEGIVLE